jgi:hypothetical protein
MDPAKANGFFMGLPFLLTVSRWPDAAARGCSQTADLTCSTIGACLPVRLSLK